MKKHNLGILIYILVAIPLSEVRGQQDGQCTIELTLSADIVAELEDVLIDTQSGFGPADHAIAAPFTTTSPVADGVIGENEYPNVCHYTFGELENPGSPLPGKEGLMEEINGSFENDLSVDMHVAHTDQFVFFGFDVTDEFLDVEEGVDAWRNDGVELWVNPDLDLDDSQPFDINNEAFKVVGDVTGDGDIELNNRSGLVLAPAPEAPPNGDEFFSAGVPSDKGWVVELQIPLAGLDKDSDGGASIVPMETGDIMLINWVVNDTDEDGGRNNAPLWVVEDDPREPQAGQEHVWPVPLQLTAGGPQPTALQAGDADQDLDFDQLDLVKVQIAAKYLTGQAATWGEGDWNGAPGGEPGSPPAGNGFFDQLDIIAALGPGHYLTGPYGAIKEGGMRGDDQTSLVYDAGTGELSVDSPAGKELTSINITSTASQFIGDKPTVLDGAFDNFAADNIFKATFGGSFGDISFGNALPAGLSSAELAADLTAVGSLAGGGDLGEVDLIWIPEPTAFLLMTLGALIVLSRRIK